MPEVSVIIPCYNTGHYLAEAIQSVLDQTFTDFEVVIVDDGSTDNTPEVVRSFDDSRIRYVWQENKGLPGARNTGIRASSGEYVAFLDADDWFLPRKLELQVRSLDEHPEVGLVATGWIETDAAGSALREVRPWERRRTLALRDWLMDCPVVPSVVLVRRWWLEQVGLFDETLKRIEDWDLWLRLARAGCRMVWLTQPVAMYRIHAGNMVRDVHLMREGLLRVMDKLFSDQTLSEDILQQRDAAYAHAYLHAAARSYAAGAFDLAKADVARAIEREPSLLDGPLPEVVRKLRSWSHHPLVPDAIGYLRAIQEHLPKNGWALRRHFKRAVAEEYLGSAFASHERGDLAGVRRSIWRALKYNPAHLRNRGVLSITVESLVGRRAAGGLRSVFRSLTYREYLPPNTG